jgi:glycosyltransferase involved in cell wall biosynthesis
LRFPELLTGPSQRYYRQIYRAAAEAERIIAVSETTRRDLLELVAPSLADKIAVVPEGVDSWFAPRDPDDVSCRLRERFDVARPFFLFVGTIEPRKNLRRLIRAFEQFRARPGNSGVDLLLAGGRGWLSDELSAEPAVGSGSVRFLGRVVLDDLIDLYNGSLALVLVSLYEGFGLPALEAMACGRATLVSSTGSMPDLVGPAGLPVDPTDETAIADALERLWHDEALRTSLGRLGRERAAQYSWPTVARQTATVYAQAAACAS